MTVQRKVNPTLPTEELIFGDYKQELESFAARMGRPDGSLTANEYIAFLAGRGERHDPDRIRQWFGEICALFAAFRTRATARKALVSHIEDLLESADQRRTP